MIDYVKVGRGVDAKIYYLCTVNMAKCPGTCEVWTLNDMGHFRLPVLSGH